MAESSFEHAFDEIVDEHRDRQRSLRSTLTAIKQIAFAAGKILIQKCVVRSWALVMSLLGSGLGEPLGRDLAPHAHDSVARLAPSPYIDRHAVEPTVTWGSVPYTQFEPQSSAGGPSARPALAPSPYELAPPIDLAPSPYGSIAWLAPNPYLDRHAVPSTAALASPDGQLGLQRSADGASAPPALAPSPYVVAAPTDLAPSPY